MNAKMTIQLLALLLTPLLATTSWAGEEQPKPHVMTQGEFAVMLHRVLVLKPDASWPDANYKPEPLQISAGEIDEAIQYLDKQRLVPYGGWHPSEAIRMHHMTSLIVACHNAQDRVDIADREKCLEFSRDVGCNPTAGQAVIVHIRKMKNSANQAFEAIGDPESPQPQR